MNTGSVDPQAAELANAATVAPPPMIKTSHSYRCKDNSLIFVDFMTDDMTATFKSTKDGTPETLKAPAAGKPYVSTDGSKTITAAARRSPITARAARPADAPGSLARAAPTISRPVPMGTGLFRMHAPKPLP